MKDAVKATHNSSVIGGVGGFAGLYDVSKLLTYKRPLLATSTDGVGTKVAIAQAMDIHDTIGFDLVGMVVDDIVVVGAEPLYMTDYIACGKVVPERIADIVRGIAAACSVAGTALVGGETAEHPGLLGEHEYDVAGAATGVVEADALLGPDRVRAGDVVIGMASSGLHSNGYSLVRRVINHAGWALDRQVSELGRTLGEELLEPTRVYAADCLDLARTFPVNGSAAGKAVHGFSHVTGGGLAANLARVLPQGLLATVDRATWELPAIFKLVSELGNVPLADLERTLNLGVGMVAIVSAGSRRRRREPAQRPRPAVLDHGHRRGRTRTRSSRPARTTSRAPRASTAAPSGWSTPTPNHRPSLHRVLRNCRFAAKTAVAEHSMLRLKPPAG